ncbi:hypothetical protein [Chitinimonas lacunae]|uniref:Uncharacterized protein n=1 Tax=Chitinimonas lacunae TaxID=1963018 RepID=A0ABV8MKT6_9NEIS
MNPIQRYLDWRRERRIARLSDAMLAAWHAGDRSAARMHHDEMMAEIRARSAAQIGRMEARKRVLGRTV